MAEIGGYVFYDRRETATLFSVTYRTFQRWLNGARPQHIPPFETIIAPSDKQMFRGEQIHRILSECYQTPVTADVAKQMLAQGRKQRNPPNDISTIEGEL